MNQPNNNNDDGDDDVLPNVIFMPAEVSEEEKEEEQDAHGETEEAEQEEDAQDEQEEEGGGGEEEDTQEEQEQEDTQEEGGAGGGGGGGDSPDSSYHAPPELRMSEQEKAWAWNLMKWMENEDPDRVARCMETGGKVPSDYEYSLHAIHTKGNKEKADQNIRGMQLFRQKYNIQDTVEEGVSVFRDFIQLHPGCVLHVDAITMEGSHKQGSLLAIDSSKFFPARARASSENLRMYMVFFYYLFQVCCAPNFDVLRGGLRFLCETTGMSHRNMDARLEQQIFHELVSHLPVDWKELRCYNTNDFVNSFLDLVKHFMPDEMRDKITVGCRLEAHQVRDPGLPPVINGILNAVLPAPPPRLTLPQAFLQPNYDVAMQNLMTKARTLLEERYHNEETFELFSEASSPQRGESEEGSLSGSSA